MNSWAHADLHLEGASVMLCICSVSLSKPIPDMLPASVHMSNPCTSKFYKQAHSPDTRTPVRCSGAATDSSDIDNKCVVGE